MDRMKKGFLSLFMVMALVIVFAGNYERNVYAVGNANIEVTSAEGSVGDTVTITVKVTTDVDGMAHLAISYDTNYLEYLSGGANSGVAGQVVDIIDDIKAGTPAETQISFKLKKSGQTVVSVGETTQVYPINASDDAPMAITKVDGNVTANAAENASSDSHLSGLIVQSVSTAGVVSEVGLTPAFSADVYEYTASVPSDTKSLNVSTTLSDPKASVKVEGTKMTVGNNKTTVTVSAVDGTTSLYNIYTTVPASETQVETDAAGNPIETTAQVGPDGVDRSPWYVEDIQRWMIMDFNLVTIPSGYKENVANFRGKRIAILYNETTGIKLVCLADDAQGTNADLFLFGEGTGSISQRVSIDVASNEYTILPLENTYTGPEGYKEVSLDIGGKVVQAWIKEDGSEFYVVYAMNSSGDKNLYVYDTVEKTMQRFVDGGKTDNAGQEPQQDNGEYQALLKKYNNAKTDYEGQLKKQKKKIVGIIIFAILGIIVAPYVFNKYKEKNNKHEGSINTNLLQSHDDKKKNDNVTPASIVEQVKKEEEIEFIDIEKNKKDKQ